MTERRNRFGPRCHPRHCAKEGELRQSRSKACGGADNHLFSHEKGQGKIRPRHESNGSRGQHEGLGSFDPDSISKRESVWYLRERRLPRRMEKTDAASVEEMTAPIRKLSATPRSRMKWASAASPKAERTTPTVDKRTDALRTGRAALSLSQSLHRT